MIIVNIRKLIRNEIAANVFILITSIILIYLLISIYFVTHTFFSTSIIGIDISLKSYQELDDIIRSSIKNN